MMYPKTLTSNQDYLNESLAYFQQISSVNYPWLISALAQALLSSSCQLSFHLFPFFIYRLRISFPPIDIEYEN